MEQYEKVKPKNNRERRSPTQRHRKYIPQNHRRKLSQPKEGYAYKGIRSLQNTKQAGPKRKKSPHHIIIKTLSMQNKERILRTAKEKGQVTYKGRHTRITPDFSMETIKAKRF